MATGGARGVRSGQDRDAAGKVAEEAVIRVLLLGILIVVLLEKTTHEPELRSAAVTDGQERAGSNGPKPNQQMGDNLPSSRRRSRSMLATPAAPTASTPSSAARHRVRGRAASTPRNARSARAGSPTTSRAVRHPSPRHQPAGRPDAVPAPSRSCRRSPASSSPRPRPCFHDASWEEAAMAHLLQRPMSMISDQRQVAPCRRDVQVPAPQARDRPVLQGRPGPRTWQCSHQRQPPAARTYLRRRGYRATDEEPAPRGLPQDQQEHIQDPERGRALPHHQGAKELPDIPPKGKHIANAHNLHERLVKHENLRFTDDPDVSFTNNAGEQKIRMAKVKVSGCFRSTQKHGAGAQATSPPWPHSATIITSPPRSPSTEKPQASSTSTTTNQNPTRGE